MNKRLLVYNTLITILIFIIGFVTVIYMDANSYQDNVISDTEKIVELTATDISNKIDNIMNTPVDVSNAMANNTFLQSWLEEEPADVNSRKAEELYEYLKSYQKEYNFDTVFLVSDKTKNYYYQDGYSKTISEEQSHDVWYYNFKDLNIKYDLQVDADELNGEIVSIFVNYRITDEEGNFLGAVGVGERLDSIYDDLRYYQKLYDLDVYAINVKETANSYNGETELFITEEQLQEMLNSDKPVKLNTSEKMESSWFEKGHSSIFMTSMLQDSLHWEIIVLKNTDTMMEIFLDRLWHNSAILALVMLICVLSIFFISFKSNAHLFSIENTDDLTKLPNRKLFYHRIDKYYKTEHNDESVFMIDIDNFKIYNDEQGHGYGNKILKLVASELKSSISGKGVVARWGGDEFIGILNMPPEAAEEVLQGIMERLKKKSKNLDYDVTLSIGITVMGDKGIEADMQIADEALYQSKAEGKNKITIKKN